MILNSPQIDLFDFSKPVLLPDDEKPESSDEDDGFPDIPSQMKFNEDNGILDYNEYK